MMCIKIILKYITISILQPVANSFKRAINVLHIEFTEFYADSVYFYYILK